MIVILIKLLRTVIRGEEERTPGNERNNPWGDKKALV